MKADPRGAPRPATGHGLAFVLPLLAVSLGVAAVLVTFAVAGWGPFGDSDPSGVAVTPVEASGAAAAEPEANTSASLLDLPPVQMLTTQPEAPPLGEETGMRVVIPKLGVDQATITMGIMADGSTFQVPNSAHEIAWYNFSGAPGSAQTNAIFASHINYYGRAGSFNQIHNLAEGDIVEIHQIDGTMHTYRVIWTKRIYKPSLTWEDVGCRPDTGCTSQNTITLITCGGAFDRSSGHYVDNTVVRAELVETTHSLS
jgi:sortase (surface protein transpeptidase)